MYAAGPLFQRDGWFVRSANSCGGYEVIISLVLLLTNGGEYTVTSSEAYSHVSHEHEVEFAQKLAEIDSRSKSNTKRLDRLEELTETVHELAMTMKLMADKQERTAETVERLDTKLSAIEQEPAKRWKSIVDKVILTIVAALVGFALAQIGIT